MIPYCTVCHGATESVIPPGDGPNNDSVARSNSTRAGEIAATTPTGSGITCNTGTATNAASSQTVSLSIRGTMHLRFVTKYAKQANPAAATDQFQSAVTPA